LHVDVGINLSHLVPEQLVTICLIGRQAPISRKWYGAQLLAKMKNRLVFGVNEHSVNGITPKQFAEREQKEWFTAKGPDILVGHTITLPLDRQESGDPAAVGGSRQVVSPSRWDANGSALDLTGQVQSSAKSTCWKMSNLESGVAFIMIRPDCRKASSASA
jgi:hypothetical protein